MKKGLIKLNKHWLSTIIKAKYTSSIYSHYVSPTSDSLDKHNVYIYLSLIGKILITVNFPLAVIGGGFKQALKEYKEVMNKPCSAYEISSELAKLLILVGKQ